MSEFTQLLQCIFNNKKEDIDENMIIINDFIE